jgi:predicted RNA-binding protein with PIN domain
MTAAMKDRQVYAVSSDSLVQTDAFTHGALRISSREFLSILERTEEEIRIRLN